MSDSERQSGELVVTPRIRIPLAEFEFTFSRSAGPGGQNVNKVNSKARLRWPVTQSPSLPDDVRERFLTAYGSRIVGEGEILIVSQVHRDQARNIDDCLTKLREMIAAVAPTPKRRRAVKPSRAQKERRLREKKAQGEKKSQRRFPTD